MSLILSIETSTNVCAVALHDAGELVAVLETRREFSHASKLAVMIEEALRLGDAKARQLAGVAVSSGPGSYTGLRIGTSTAKGICYALEIPLVAVSTLEVLAAQVSTPNVPRAVLCPMLDARRMEVYCQLFDSARQPLGAMEAKIIDETSFREQLAQGPVIFFGDGAAKCKEVIRHKDAIFKDGVLPSAVALGALAWHRFQQQQWEDLVGFQPVYLKEFMIKKPADKAVNKMDV